MIALAYSVPTGVLAGWSGVLDMILTPVRVSQVRNHLTSHEEFQAVYFIFYIYNHLDTTGFKRELLMIRVKNFIKQNNSVPVIIGRMYSLRLKKEVFI